MAATAAWLGIAGGTTAGCETTPADCVTLLNAIFDQGTYGADSDSGAPEPADWRRTSLDGATYLTQAYPDGDASWSGVFAMSFTPAP